MKKVLLALAGAAISASAIAVPTAVFRAVPDDPTKPDAVTLANRMDGSMTTFYFPAGDTIQIGDEITLAPGTPRNIVEMSVFLTQDLAVAATDETARVRLYRMDGPPVGTRADSPGTLIWDSGPKPIVADDRAMRFAIAEGVGAPVSVTVPDRIAWTLETAGTAGVAGDQFGATNYGPPTVGTTDLNLWLWDGTQWVNTDYASQWADLFVTRAAPCLGMTMWADGTTTQPYDALSFYVPIVGSGFAMGAFFAGGDAGDDVQLEGNNRRITKFELGYRAADPTPNGDEGVELRFHNILEDGTDMADNTPFYVHAAPVLIDVSGTTGTGKIAVFNLPDVDVPRNFVYMFKPVGTYTAPENYLMSGTKTVLIGSNRILMYRHNALGDWDTFWWNGDPTPTSDPSSPTTNTGGNLISVLAARMKSEHRLEYNSASITTGSTFSGNSNNITSYTPDLRWGIRPGAVLVATADKIVTLVNFYLPASTVSTMNVVVHSKATASGIRQRVNIKDGAAATFTQLETFTGLPSGANPDREVTLPVTSPSSKIDVAAGNKVTIRLNVNNTTAVLVWPFQYQIDAVYLDITP